jgi:hypothetical protein
MLIGCICCHGPTDRNGNCPHCDERKIMREDHEDLKDISGNRVAQLVPSKTDADYAAELRQRIVEAYKPLFTLLEEADKKGFNINSTVGKDYMGRFTFATLQVMKVY